MRPEQQYHHIFPFKNTLQFLISGNKSVVMEVQYFFIRLNTNSMVKSNIADRKNGLLLCLLFCILCFAKQKAFCQVPLLDWAGNVGSTAAAEGSSVCSDASGSVYVTGKINGTADFDPGPGLYVLSASANDDIFVMKLNQNGTLSWAKAIGGLGYDWGYGITTDDAGYVYVTGMFEGTVDFNPGGPTRNLVSTGSSDAFVYKLDSAGNFQWAKSIGGGGTDRGFSIAVDSAENVYLTGLYNYLPIDLDPGPDTLYAPVKGSTDIFVCKMDSAGDLAWGGVMGGTGEDRPNSIALDSHGSVYITGFFWGTADFDPSPSSGFNLVSSGYSDAFVCKLESNGNFVLAKAFGGPTGDEGVSVDINPVSKEILLCGSFSGTADFNPTPAVYSLTADGAYDTYISALDSNGVFKWAKQLATISPGNTVPRMMTLDQGGNILITGSFEGTVDFNPGPGTFIITAGASYNDIFTCKLDNSGGFVWAERFGGSFDDSGNAICIAVSGAIISTGYFVSTMDISPGPDVYNLVAAGREIYFQQIYECEATTDSIVASACVEYLSPSGNFIWTSSGFHEDVLVNASGCDSIIIVDLTIFPVNVSVTSMPPVLTSNAIGATYQWIHCDGTLMPGDTSQSFTATTSGSYAVVVSQGGCTDTSACYMLAITDGMEPVVQEVDRVHPNPTRGRVKIDLNQTRQRVEATLIDSRGLILQRQRYWNIAVVELEIANDPGLYILIIQSDDLQPASYKIIKL